MSNYIVISASVCGVLEGLKVGNSQGALGPKGANESGQKEGVSVGARIYWVSKNQTDWSAW